MTNVPLGSNPTWRYRKRPVVIEARQLGRDYDEDCDIVRWCGGRAIGEQEDRRAGGDAPEGAIVKIPTREGPLYASPGDWIIRGVKGEFYPCKSDIFEATYEHA